MKQYHNNRNGYGRNHMLNRYTYLLFILRYENYKLIKAYIKNDESILDNMLIMFYENIGE